MAEKFPDPEIEALPARKIVGISRDYDMATRHQIGAQWQDYCDADIRVENEVAGAMYGVNYKFRDGGRFSYCIGVAVNPVGAVSEGSCVVTTANGPHAVFRMRAPITRLPELFDHIFQTWLPASDFAAAEGAVVECYPDEPMDTAGHPVYEIWVPVRKRAG